jgi:hypothetical protein
MRSALFTLLIFATTAAWGQDPDSRLFQIIGVSSGPATEGTNQVWTATYTDGTTRAEQTKSLTGVDSQVGIRRFSVDPVGTVKGVPVAIVGDVQGSAGFGAGQITVRTQMDGQGSGWSSHYQNSDSQRGIQVEAKGRAEYGALIGGQSLRPYVGLELAGSRERTSDALGIDRGVASVQGAAGVAWTGKVLTILSATAGTSRMHDYARADYGMVFPSASNSVGAKVVVAGSRFVASGSAKEVVGNGDGFIITDRTGQLYEARLDSRLTKRLSLVVDGTFSHQRDHFIQLQDEKPGSTENTNSVSARIVYGFGAR